MDSHTSNIKSEVLKVDHSFKVPKYIMHCFGEKTFLALFTAVNEIGQIRIQGLTVGKSLNELRIIIGRFKDECIKRNIGLPGFIFTDNCCADRAFFESEFPHLVNSVSSGIYTKYLQLPSDIEIINVETVSHCNNVCNSFLAENNVVLGLDAEWYVHNKSPQKLSIIQICHAGFVFIIYMFKLKRIPLSLEQLLLSPNIIKTGKNVAADVRKVFRDWGNREIENTMEIGLCELGMTAKKKLVVEKASASLSDILFRVSGFELDKTPRLSNWEQYPLPAHLVQYAAIDAYASLKVYISLSSLSVVSRLKSTIDEGHSICILQKSLSSNIVIASGTVHSSVGSKQLNVFVEEVYAPGALLGVSDIEAKDAVGQVVLCDIKQLSIEHEKPTVGDCSDSIPVETATPLAPESIRNEQRVLEDVFHFMDRIKVKQHPLRKLYFSLFSLSIFSMDTSDYEAVRKVFVENGESDKFENTCFFWDDYMQKRIRRYIRPPRDLVPRLKEFFSLFLSIDGFFTDNQKTQIPDLLLHAEKGCITDPEGLVMYIEIGTDSDSLKLYKCIRGTNATESYHQKAIKSFSPYNASAEFGNALLGDNRLRHNYRAAVRFAGTYDCGHYDLHLIDLLQLVYCKIFDRPLFDDWDSSLDWSPTTESFGIVPIWQPGEIQLPSVLPALSEQYRYLASRMETEYPCLPIHTDDEKKLFKKCILKGLTTDQMVASFANSINGSSIFLKTPEQLRQYDKKFKDLTESRKLIAEYTKQIGDIERTLFDTRAMVPSVQLGESLLSIPDPPITDDAPEDPAMLLDHDADFPALADVSQLLVVAPSATTAVTYPAAEITADEINIESNISSDDVQMRSIVPSMQVGIPLNKSTVSLQAESLIPETNVPSVVETKTRTCRVHYITDENIRMECGKTDCKGSQGSIYCKTPREEYRVHVPKKRKRRKKTE